jgi:hypothetical protein
MWRAASPKFAQRTRFLDSKCNRYGMIWSPQSELAEQSSDDGMPDGHEVVIAAEIMATDTKDKSAARKPSPRPAHARRQRP